MVERVKLTERAVEALVPGDVERIFWDKELHGFGVRLYPSGTRKYVVQYRTSGGKTRRMVLGTYPVLSSDKARKAARKHLVAVTDGGDPAGEKQAHRASMTIAELCTAYFDACDAGLVLARNGKPKKPLTLYNDKGRVKRHVVPLIGSIKAADTTRADVERLKAGIVTGKTATNEKTGKRGRAIVKGGRGAATRALGLLGGIFQWGCQQGIMDTNPARGVKRFADAQRKQLLTLEQYRMLGMAIEALEVKRTKNDHPKFHPCGLAAIRFIALTGARKGEVVNLLWSEVDFANRCLRLTDTKTGASVRPLSGTVADLVKGLDKISNHVFAAGPDREGHGGLPRLWEHIRAEARPADLPADQPGPLDAITMHGLRHSFAGTAEDIGCSMPTISALIGHKLPGVTAGYVLKRLDGPLIASGDRVAMQIDHAMRGTTTSAAILNFPVTALNEYVA